MIGYRNSISTLQSAVRDWLANTRPSAHQVLTADIGRVMEDVEQVCNYFNSTMSIPYNLIFWTKSKAVLQTSFICFGTKGYCSLRRVVEDHSSFLTFCLCLHFICLLILMLVCKEKDRMKN